MQSIESLYLEHPDYVVDWGLLRTLQVSFILQSPLYLVLHSQPCDIPSRIC